MTSQKQVAANQRNGKRSTGPNTSEGKARSRLNALSHGLTAETVVIKGEDAEQFEALRRHVFDEFGPENFTESQLVERLAALLWRLRRTSLIEAALIEYHRLEIERNNALANVEPYGNVQGPRTVTPSVKIKEEYENDPDCIKASKRLSEAEAALRKSLPILGSAFVRDASHYDSLGKLSRYESSLIRALDKTLEQIEKFRATRHEQQESFAGIVDLHPIGSDETG